jgi:hypothetical protein
MALPGFKETKGRTIFRIIVNEKPVNPFGIKEFKMCKVSVNLLYTTFTPKKKSALGKNS